MLSKRAKILIGRLMGRLKKGTNYVPQGRKTYIDLVNRPMNLKDIEGDLKREIAKLNNEILNQGQVTSSNEVALVANIAKLKKLEKTLSNKLEAISKAYQGFDAEGKKQSKKELDAAEKEYQDNKNLLQEQVALYDKFQKLKGDKDLVQEELVRYQGLPASDMVTVFATHFLLGAFGKTLKVEVEKLDSSDKLVKKFMDIDAVDEIADDANYKEVEDVKKTNYVRVYVGPNLETYKKNFIIYLKHLARASNETAYKNLKRYIGNNDKIVKFVESYLEAPKDIDDLKSVFLETEASPLNLKNLTEQLNEAEASLKTEEEAYHSRINDRIKFLKDQIKSLSSTPTLDSELKETHNKVFKSSPWYRKPIDIEKRVYEANKDRYVLAGVPEMVEETVIDPLSGSKRIEKKVSVDEDGREIPKRTDSGEIIPIETQKVSKGTTNFKSVAQQAKIYQKMGFEKALKAFYSQTEAAAIERERNKQEGTAIFQKNLTAKAEKEKALLDHKVSQVELAKSVLSSKSTDWDKYKQKVIRQQELLSVNIKKDVERSYKKQSFYFGGISYSFSDIKSIATGEKSKRKSLVALQEWASEQYNSISSQIDLEVAIKQKEALKNNLDIRFEKIGLIAKGGDILIDTESENLVQTKTIGLVLNNISKNRSSGFSVKELDTNILAPSIIWNSKTLSNYLKGMNLYIPESNSNSRVFVKPIMTEEKYNSIMSKLDELEKEKDEIYQALNDKENSEYSLSLEKSLTSIQKKIDALVNEKNSSGGNKEKKGGIELDILTGKSEGIKHDKWYSEITHEAILNRLKFYESLNVPEDIEFLMSKLTANRNEIEAFLNEYLDKAFYIAQRDLLKKASSTKYKITELPKKNKLGEEYNSYTNPLIASMVQVKEPDPSLERRLKDEMPLLDEKYYKNEVLKSEILSLEEDLKNDEKKGVIINPLRLQNIEDMKKGLLSDEDEKALKDEKLKKDKLLEEAKYGIYEYDTTKAIGILEKKFNKEDERIVSILSNTKKYENEIRALNPEVVFDGEVGTLFSLKDEFSKALNMPKLEEKDAYNYYLKEIYTLYLNNGVIPFDPKKVKTDFIIVENLNEELKGKLGITKKSSTFVDQAFNDIVKRYQFAIDVVSNKIRVEGIRIPANESTQIELDVIGAEKLKLEEKITKAIQTGSVYQRYQNEIAQWDKKIEKIQSKFKPLHVIEDSITTPRTRTGEISTVSPWAEVGFIKSSDLTNVDKVPDFQSFVNEVKKGMFVVFSNLIKRAWAIYFFIKDKDQNDISDEMAVSDFISMLSKDTNEAIIERRKFNETNVLDGLSSLTISRKDARTGVTTRDNPFVSFKSDSRVLELQSKLTDSLKEGKSPEAIKDTIVRTLTTKNLIKDLGYSKVVDGKIIYTQSPESIANNILKSVVFKAVGKNTVYRNVRTNYYEISLEKESEDGGVSSLADYRVGQEYREERLNDYHVKKDILYVSEQLSSQSHQVPNIIALFGNDTIFQTPITGLEAKTQNYFSKLRARERAKSQLIKNLKDIANILRDENIGLYWNNGKFMHITEGEQGMNGETIYPNVPEYDFSSFNLNQYFDLYASITDLLDADEKFNKEKAVLKQYGFQGSRKTLGTLYDECKELYENSYAINPKLRDTTDEEKRAFDLISHFVLTEELEFSRDLCTADLNKILTSRFERVKQEMLKKSSSSLKEKLFVAPDSKQLTALMTFFRGLVLETQAKAITPSIIRAVMEGDSASDKFKIFIKKIKEEEARLNIKLLNKDVFSRNELKAVMEKIGLTQYSNLMRDVLKDSSAEELILANNDDIKIEAIQAVQNNLIEELIDVKINTKDLFKDSLSFNIPDKISLIPYTIIAKSYCLTVLIDSIEGKKSGFVQKLKTFFQKNPSWWHIFNKEGKVESFRLSDITDLYRDFFMGVEKYLDKDQDIYKDAKRMFRSPASKYNFQFTDKEDGIEEKLASKKSAIQKLLISFYDEHPELHSSVSITELLNGLNTLSKGNIDLLITKKIKLQELGNTTDPTELFNTSSRKLSTTGVQFADRLMANDTNIEDLKFLKSIRDEKDIHQKLSFAKSSLKTKLKIKNKNLSNVTLHEQLVKEAVQYGDLIDKLTSALDANGYFSGLNSSNQYHVSKKKGSSIDSSLEMIYNTFKDKVRLDAYVGIISEIYNELSGKEYKIVEFFANFLNILKGEKEQALDSAKEIEFDAYSQKNLIAIDILQKRINKLNDEEKNTALSDPTLGSILSQRSDLLDQIKTLQQNEYSQAVAKSSKIGLSREAIFAAKKAESRIKTDLEITELKEEIMSLEEKLKTLQTELSSYKGDLQTDIVDAYHQSRDIFKNIANEMEKNLNEMEDPLKSALGLFLSELMKLKGVII